MPSAALCAALCIVGCSSNDTGAPPPAGAWGSNQGALTVGDTSSDLLIANGSCYGATGHLSGRIPAGHVSMSGTFTQLIGAVPGYVQYPAQYTGTADTSTITLTITVSGLGQSIGPLSVANGVVKNFPACLFP